MRFGGRAAGADGAETAAGPCAPLRGSAGAADAAGGAAMSEPPLDAPADAWMVGFATVTEEAAARRLAAGIRGARVVPATRDGAPAWRVIAGPYPSREAAERAGIASDRPFWVYEAGP